MSSSNVSSVELGAMHYEITANAAELAKAIAATETQIKDASNMILQFDADLAAGGQKAEEAMQAISHATGMTVKQVQQLVDKMALAQAATQSAAKKANEYKAAVGNLSNVVYAFNQQAGQMVAGLQGAVTAMKTAATASSVLNASLGVLGAAAIVVGVALQAFKSFSGTDELIEGIKDATGSIDQMRDAAIKTKEKLLDSVQMTAYGGIKAYFNGTVDAIKKVNLQIDGLNKKMREIARIESFEKPFRNAMQAVRVLSLETEHFYARGIIDMENYYKTLQIAIEDEEKAQLAKLGKMQLSEIEFNTKRDEIWNETSIKIKANELNHIKARENAGKKAAADALALSEQGHRQEQRIAMASLEYLRNNQTITNKKYYDEREKMARKSLAHGLAAAEKMGKEGESRRLQAQDDFRYESARISQERQENEKRVADEIAKYDERRAISLAKYGKRIKIFDFDEQIADLKYAYDLHSMSQEEFLRESLQVNDKIRQANLDMIQAEIDATLELEKIEALTREKALLEAENAQKRTAELRAGVLAMIRDVNAAASAQVGTFFKGGAASMVFAGMNSPNTAEEQIADNTKRANELLRRIDTKIDNLGNGGVPVMP